MQRGPEPEPPRRPSLALRAGLVIAGCAIILGLYTLDASYKRWPDNGYVLPDASFTLASDDFPGFWQGLLDTTAGHDIAQALSRQRGDLERDFRLATGIRPTPLRWSLWLGNRVVISSPVYAFTACVRPGLLFRAYHRALELTGRLNVVDGVEEWGNFHLLERDGYLLISKAQLNELHEAVVLKEFPTREKGAASPTLFFRAKSGLGRERDADFRGHVEATEGWPAEVTLVGNPYGAAAPTAPLPKNFDDSDVSPVCDLFTQDFALYANLLEGTYLEVFSPFVQWPKNWLLRTPSNVALPWTNRGADHAPNRYMWFGTECQDGWALNHEGFAMCNPDKAWNQHPFLENKSYPPYTYIPYAWGDVNGFLLPVQGADYTYGCAVKGPWACAANPPENLPSVLTDEDDHAVPGPHLRIAMHWDRYAPIWEANLRQLCALGEIPGDGLDFDNRYGSRVKACAALGVTDLVSVPSAEHPDWLVVRGHLADRSARTQGAGS